MWVFATLIFAVERYFVDHASCLFFEEEEMCILAEV